jgi:hypothetical protein
MSCVGQGKQAARSRFGFGVAAEFDRSAASRVSLLFDAMRVYLKGVVIIGVLLIPNLSCSTVRRASSSECSCSPFQELTNLDKTQKEVLRVNKELTKAFTKKDWLKLDQILADEFAETDCNGKVINKSDILTLIRRKGRYYHSEGYIERCTVTGDTAEVVGGAVIESDLSDMCDEIQFTRNYRNFSGVWRVISSKEQSTE